MLELEEALAKVLAAVPPPSAEPVALNEAYERTSTETIRAPLALPVFDNSSVDGYAVRAADVAGASPSAPVRLRLAGRVAAGETFESELATGCCVRLFTGSPLPPGADAAVMQEDTRTEPDHPGEVSILETVKPWENVRLRGEDVKPGTTVVKAGEVLSVGRITLLAAVGAARVSVGRRPRVGLLATGSELKEPGGPLAPGEIYESNRAGLALLIGRAGGLARVFPVVTDVLEETRVALGHAMHENDVVVTCGGVSVGELDYVKSAFEQLGGQLEFWRVAIKPGRPFAFGRLGGKLLFGLPGNPVSALVTFLLLVRPALLRWQGALEVALPSCPGVLAERIANPGTRRSFLRVTVDAAGAVHSAGGQSSHFLSSLAEANGLLDVPPETAFDAGLSVPVMRWEFR